MKKLFFFTLMTYFSTAQLAAADIPNADDLCYDKDQVFTEGTGCVDFGPFSGGFNCKKTIPLRNISDDTLSDVSVLWDIDDGFKADFVESCGIDGTNKKGGACKFHALIHFGPFNAFEDSILFDPMPDFTASGESSEHSIYLYNLMAGRVDPFVFFRDGVLQANYRKNGDTYTGTVKACKRHWKKVEHLCYDYDAITYDNSLGLGICMDFGPFKGGFACKQNIPIRSLTNQDISDIDIVLDQHGMNGSMLGDCGIDGNSKKASGKCQDRTLFNFGPMGMIARGFMFDMPDYDKPFDKHSIFTRSMMSMKMDPVAFFTGENMYTHYTVDSKKYDGYIPACKVNKKPVKDLCYVHERVNYEPLLLDGKLGVCAEFGPFKGGMGCKQSIPIRSNTNTKLTQVDILFDEHGMNGDFLGDCGIGTKSGFLDQSCKENQAFDFGPMGMFSRGVIFDPMSNYAPFEEHTIYMSSMMEMSFDPVAMFTGENLYTHYVKEVNGTSTLISGKIPACKKNYADDLCMTKHEPVVKPFPFYNPPYIGTYAKIKHQRTDILEQTDVYVNTDTLWSIDCRVDSELWGRDCVNKDNIDMFMIGFSGTGSSFDMHTFSPGTQRKVTRSVSLYDGIWDTLESWIGNFEENEKVFASYLKNEEWYSYRLGYCLTKKKLSLMTGTFGAWDNYRVGIHGTGDRHIATKIVNKPFTLSIASINEAQDAYQAKNVSTDIAYGLIEPDGTSFIVNGGSFDASKVTLFEHEFTVSRAYRELEVGFKLCSEISHGKLILHDSAKCAAVEVLACDDAHAGTHWRMCPSDDSFSVRPDHFTFKLPFMTDKRTLRSGEIYKYEITAKDYASNPTNGYNQSGNHLNDDNASILFADSSENNGSLHGTIDYDGSSFDFADGISTSAGETYVANVSFDDVGKISLLLQDAEWTSVDSNDTPSSCDAGMKNGVNVPNGRFVCGLTRPTFIPHHFRLANAKLVNHNNGAYTYLGIKPSNENDDIDMSAHVDMTVIAENKPGVTTENFSEGLYENPVSVTLTVPDITVPDITGNGITMTAFKHDLNEIDVTPATIGFGEIGVNSAGTFHFAWDTTTPAEKLNFNYVKDPAVPTQPFRLESSDPGFDINVTSDYSGTKISGSIKEPISPPTGSATFHYVKVAATKKLYPNINTNSVPTPIRALVYCPTSVVCSALSIDIINDGTIDAQWWISRAHKTSQGYGKIGLHVTAGGGTVTSLAPIESNGINRNIIVSNTSGVVPNTVSIDTDPATTDDWMITEDSGSDIDFIGASGWAGHGKAGNVVGGQPSHKKNNKLNW